MQPDRRLAGWLVSQRASIERAMALRLGPAVPGAADPEAEALRRFRSFASASLLRGTLGAPALDGLRANERRVGALLEAWSAAAAEVAGPDGESLTVSISPLIAHFRQALRGTARGRRARGTPRATRRAVVAAIDRVADAFLAIDTDDGKIVDANPAAGSLLGVNRDALLGVDAMSFVPEAIRPAWWTQLEALCEGDESRVFGASMIDASGDPLRVDASVTRFASRGRVLALLLMRPESEKEIDRIC